jgi:hypothetical protein
MKPILRNPILLCVAWCAAALVPNTLLCQNLPTPGPEHAVLKRLEGEWTATVKMGGTETPGTMTLKMECGGLWLVSDFHSEFGGQKFQGRGMDGYDPEKKKYVSVWVDSMSTRPMLLEGSFDKEKKLLTLTGEGPGPDGKPAKYRNTTHTPDDDHQTFIMHVTGADGKETQVMTITYVRKK